MGIWDIYDIRGWGQCTSNRPRGHFLATAKLSQSGAGNSLNEYVKKEGPFLGTFCHHKKSSSQGWILCLKCVGWFETANPCSFTSAWSSPSTSCQTCLHSAYLGLLQPADATLCFDPAKRIKNKVQTLQETRTCYIYILHFKHTYKPMGRGEHNPVTTSTIPILPEMLSKIPSANVHSNSFSQSHMKKCGFTINIWLL